MYDDAILLACGKQEIDNVPENIEITNKIEIASSLI